ncbi:NADH-quinone oxidoreductase subunit A [Buchnera aphidicola (Kurisakia onigurumii)]|uniref:NADH-quinone oxidoreductase subunit A n=1 Tax=Buchnera aphidicola TaxID=9 RepID=UPI0031B6CBCA
MKKNFLYSDFTTQDLSFILYFLIVIGVCSIILLISFFLGSKSISRDKNIPFESGIDGTGDTNLRFAIKFYLIAICFVIFDVEALYLYTWSICVKKVGITGLIEVFFFINTLLITLFYLVKNKIFN